MPSSGGKQRHSRKQELKTVETTPMNDDPRASSPKPYHPDSVLPLPPSDSMLTLPHPDFMLSLSPPPPAFMLMPPPPPSSPLLFNDAYAYRRQISDVTLEERSLFEYSDTSDDADAYFLPRKEHFYNSPPSLLDNVHRMHQRHMEKNHERFGTMEKDLKIMENIRGKYANDPSYGNGATDYSYNYNYYNNHYDHDSRRSRTKNNAAVGTSGESAFRELKSNGSQSTKIVRFPSGESDDGDDNRSVNEDEEDTSRMESPLSATDSEKKGGPLFGKFVKHMVHAFNTPDGFERKRDETKRRNRNTKKKAESKHKRKLSHTVTEYPYSMINLRDASSRRSSLSDLSRNSLESSPLLSTSNPHAYGAGYEAATSTSSEYYQPLMPSTKAALKTSKSERGETTTYARALSSNYLKNPVAASSQQHLRLPTTNCPYTAAQIAAYFLMDYEASRIASLPSAFETITVNQLLLYKIYFSWQWRYFVNLAIALLFLSHTRNTLTTAIMTSCVIIVLTIEIQIREKMYGTDLRTDTKHPDRKLVRPMAAFLFILGLETWMWYIVSPDLVGYESNPPLFSSVLKPLALFYVSAKARESLEAILRISQIVIRVLLIEFFMILIFASVAYRMFGNDFDDFADLQTSWLSLFQLSTTVNNPSLWMPIYAAAPSNSIFFVIFIVMCVFYYHSLVLSVVFQTYIQAITDIHERTASDRNDAIRLAFLALLKDGQSNYISTSSVRKCLQVVRPHYNSLKMNALLEIVDPTNETIIDYPTFRNKIRRALNSSVRTARTATPLAMGVEFIAVFVAGANFIYVTGKTLAGGEDFWYVSNGYVGSVITLLGFLELTIRFNPLKVPNFAPITRLDVFFDGIALLAALISCYGIVQYAAGYKALIESGAMFDYLHLGRAIDMIRVLRFSPIFRDIVRRSSDVLPTLAGPMMLFLSVIHTFVFFGIVLWSGAIDVELLKDNEDLSPLYCLNNFNSYTGGLITMFNVAVVNDWHAIAKVYTYADRNNSRPVVYSFFVSAICFIVYIMINVIIAFFVETFVTKTNEPADESYPNEEILSPKRGSNFRILNSENTNVRRIHSNGSIYSDEDEDSAFRDGNDNEDDADDEDDGSAALVDPNTSSTHSATSSKSANSETFAAFDIYEREGFDQIMRAVAGSSDAEQEAFAKSVCSYLERFESLTSGREKVGYMVCCQQSMNRFGNHRFRTLARSFLTDELLHKVVSDMHSELLALTSTTRKKNGFGNRCLVRTFPQAQAMYMPVSMSREQRQQQQQQQQPSSRHLEIAATLLRHQPAATLFASRIRPNLASGDKK